MKYVIAIGKETSRTTPLLFSGDFIKNMELAKELGYDGVEIHTADPDEINIVGINEARKRLDMSVATIGTGAIYGKYGLHLMDQNEGNKNRIVSMVKNFIDVAAEIESKVTIGSIKGNVPKGEDRKKFLETMAINLKALSEYAVLKGVSILLEATNRYENNVLNSAKDVVEMIEKYNLKNTEVLIDTFHINIEERSLKNCVKDAGEHLGYIHFGDNTRMYPGSGTFDYDTFCGSIIDFGYDGVLSVECFPQPDGLTAAKETINFFSKYFRRIKEAKNGY
jgi:sugar phosphate isomerase/epimerase